MRISRALSSVNRLFTQLAQEQYRPPSLLKKMIYEGRLGKKSGEGFYKHV
ncbi:MAG: 3-hydroxyacyl-CoA dehydrogenase family protein [bacterium]